MYLVGQVYWASQRMTVSVCLYICVCYLSVCVFVCVYVILCERVSNLFVHVYVCECSLSVCVHYMCSMSVHVYM